MDNTNNKDPTKIDLTEIMNLKKRLEAKKRGDTPTDGELTAASFRMLCEFLPAFIQGMANLGSIATINEDLKSEVISLKEDVKAYKNDISEMRAEISQMQTATNSEMKTIKDECTTLREVAQNHNHAMEIMKGKISEFEKKFLTLEVEKSESCILVRNFYQGPNENRTNLRESFSKLLQFLKLENRVRVLDIFRLVSKNVSGVNPVSKFPAVKVCFASKYEKFIFMSHLKALKNTPYGNIRVSDDVPKSLQKEFEKVDFQGYKIRMAHKGTLVRTPIRNLQYQLEIKKPNEAKYSKVEIENFESQMENLESQAHVESFSQENPSKRLRPDPES